MSNLVMEYTASVEEQVNVSLLLEELHDSMLTSGVFDTSAVKSRAVRIHQWLVGDKKDSLDFIDVTIELVDGITSEQKRALSRSLLQVLETQACCIPNLAVNIRDIERATSKKAEFH